jgi:glycine cleavage system H lipoate-binding protein/ABC-type phosphate transport system substrate-binding protein
VKTNSANIKNKKTMKKMLIIIASILLLCSGKASKIDVEDNNNSSIDRTISLIYSPDLTKIAKQWTNEYCKLNPGIKINLISINSNDLTGSLSNDANLVFISDEYYQSLENKSKWKLVVGRDIIVPIINSTNPFIDLIYQQGVSSLELADLIKKQNMGKGSLLKNGKNIPLNYYTVSNDLMKSKIVDFVKLNITECSGIEVNDISDLIKAIQNDPNGLGFCKLTDILNPEYQSLVNNIKLLPIDNNGNGQMDYIEKIYDNLNDFSRGVWIGKYPKALISNLYFVSSNTPKNKNEIAFVKYVLTDGQRLMEPNRFSELVYSERQSKLEKLSEGYINVEAKQDYAGIQIAILIILIIMVAGIIANIVYRTRRNKIKEVKNIIPEIKKVINQNSLTIPKGVYFDKTHTWVFMEKDGIVKVGVDDFLQHITGIYTRIKMKNPGDKINKNEQILSLVQNGKQINIYAPISGTIKYINEDLVTKPSLINSSPYSEGWVYMIEPSNWLREIQFLRMAEKYKEWIHYEFLRMKDFITASINDQTSAHAFVVLQDGGELKDNVLEDFEPEIWEEFQKIFIDNSVLR